MIYKKGMLLQEELSMQQTADGAAATSTIWPEGLNKALC
jgi:hypothetical protein